jgi:molybdenum-dependent DNA-binding transcriptional regulator ModE
LKEVLFLCDRYRHHGHGEGGNADLDAFGERLIETQERENATHCEYQKMSTVAWHRLPP